MTVQTPAPSHMSSTDKIEKQFVLRATRSRVWHALTRAEEFGTWFRINLDGPFTEGRTNRGKMTVAGYEHVQVEMMVERIDPERYFSYRWHPYAIDPAVDYTSEATTLVEFTLNETGDGTTVTVVESGFDRLPLARRSDAFRMNDQGWSGQMKHLAKYVE